MMTKRVVGVIVRTGRKNGLKDVFTTNKCKEPSIYHALVVIFLEFFAWGLLTTPMITVLNITFPSHTFLMNGLIMGIKGILSFLSAPLIGALSDMWGRKLFLLITVFFTCSPIPFMKINTWWYFAILSISGIFSVTFSVIFAYVADITTENERSTAYGLVSATFAASLVISPALGAYLSYIYSESLVVFIATIIAALDVLFILFLLPESLPDKLRLSTTSLWEQADPFASLRKVGKDRMILMICIAVFLSYLPEAGQYSCFFVYLRLVIGFSAEDVALFIAFVGLLSVIAQTIVLTALTQSFGSKNTILIGLLLEMIQLVFYGFGSQRWMMWVGGIIAALSTMTYPAISTYLSTYADVDKQGLVQGMITGVRGLCSGLGPAVFGLIFNLFHVDLSHHSILPQGGDTSGIANTINTITNQTDINRHKHLIQDNFVLIPGPPFLFGALLVFLAILVTIFIPDIISYSYSSTKVNTNENFFYSNNNRSMKTTQNRQLQSTSNYYYTTLNNQKNDTHCPIDCKESDASSEENNTEATSPTRHIPIDENFDLHRKRPSEHFQPLLLEKD